MLQSATLPNLKGFIANLQVYRLVRNNSLTQAVITANSVTKDIVTYVAGVVNRFLIVVSDCCLVASAAPGEDGKRLAFLFVMKISGRVWGARSQALMLYCVMFAGGGQTHSDQGKDNKHYKDINKSHFYSSPSSSDSAQAENAIVTAVPNIADSIFIPALSLDSKGFKIAITTTSLEISNSVFDNSLRWDLFNFTFSL